MTAKRRVVRVTAALFDDLDRQLPTERGPNGEPSVRDFEMHELVRLVDVFAVDFEVLPELIPGRSDYRILITTGMLVPRLSVVGQLAPDGTVELTRLYLDLDPPEV